MKSAFLLVAALAALPAAGDFALGGEGGASAVDAERAANRKAFEASIAALRREHAGEWVAIAGGKVAATGQTPQEVAAAAPLAVHRFIFRVGDEGDGEFPANFWYGPRFGGLDLAEALGITTLGGGGEETPFPRTRIDVATPSGEQESMDVLVGTVGPPLLLTLGDAEHLHLERFEVPGALKSSWIPFPFRRAVVRVSLPGKEGAWIVAAVPTGTRKQLVDLSAGRDFGYFQDVGVWAMDRWAAKRRSLEGRWALVGVDRLLGEGATAEEALLAGEGKAPEAYHRFLTRLPRTGEVAHEESAFTETAKVVLNGTEVKVRRDPQRPDGPFLAGEATAASLLLETAEDARCQVLLRAGKRLPARAGAAWLGGKPAAEARGRVTWVVTPLPAGEKVWWCEPPSRLPVLPVPPGSGK
jgi:hypothetical protein